MLKNIITFPHHLGQRLKGVEKGAIQYSNHLQDINSHKRFNTIDVNCGKDFFNMVRNHTIDGTFCDPYYGGNQNFVGWDMINYPGIRLGASEADVAAGAKLEPNHQSAYDHDTYTKMASNQLSGQRGRGGDA